MIPESPIQRPICEAQVRQILAIRDPVLRNLWITLAYHDFVEGMAGTIGRRNISWVGFATWASKTMGVSIRGEQIADLLNAQLDTSVEYRQTIGLLNRNLSLVDRGIDIRAALIPILAQAIRRMSLLIAEGNRIVFEELGPLFARMIGTVDGQGQFDHRIIEAFLATVHALGGDTDATLRLREAFRLYYLSRSAADAYERAQLVLLANGLIGWTEQMRLQPAIKGALNALVEVGLVGFLRELLGILSPLLIERLAQELERGWRRAATRFLLTLKTPERVLNLSEDAPTATLNQQFPDELVSVSSPAVRAFLHRHDLTDGVGRPSGARDWAELADRMNYIVNLFRSWQQQPSLFLAPFTSGQIACMQRGQIPEGPL